MVFNGTCTGSNASSYTVWLDVKQNSQSVPNNTSNVTVSLKLKRNDGYANSAWNGYQNENTVTLTVGGEVKVNRNMTFDTRNGATATLASWTGNVNHNSNGKLTLAISGRFTTGNAGVSGGTVSGSFACTDIVAALNAATIKSVVVNNANHYYDDGTPQSFNITYTSYNASVYMKFAIDVLKNGTYQRIKAAVGIGTKPVGDRTWNFTLTQAEANANAITVNAPTDSKEVVLSFVVTSYSDAYATQIGENRRNIPVALYPNTFKPTVNATIAPSSNGAYIQNISGASVTLNPTIKYNASVGSYYSTIDGKTYVSQSFQTPIFKASGTQTLTATVTDTRGFSATATKTITVLPYATPYITNAKCFRCDDDGNALASGAKIRLKATKNYSKVMNGSAQLNNCVMEWRYKLESAQWGEWRALGDSVNEVVSGVEFDATKAYTVEIRVSDTLGGTQTVKFDIPTDVVTIHLGEGGKGVGIGGYADSSKPESLTVAWDAYFGKDVYISNKKLIDFIHPVGSIIWTYRVNPNTVFNDTSWTDITGNCGLGNRDEEILVWRRTT